MKIIDFERKGNVVRFYLGNSIENISGDGWDAIPYELYSKKVNDEYIVDYIDQSFKFDDLVFEACNSKLCFSKNQLVKGVTPFLVVVPNTVVKELNLDLDYLNYDTALRLQNSIKYYYGNDMYK